MNSKATKTNTIHQRFSLIELLDIPVSLTVVSAANIGT
jgi:hypothetical protein